MGFPYLEYPPAKEKWCEGNEETWDNWDSGLWLESSCCPSLRETLGSICLPQNYLRCLLDSKVPVTQTTKYLRSNDNNNNNSNYSSSSRNNSNNNNVIVLNYPYVSRDGRIRFAETFAVVIAGVSGEVGPGTGSYMWASLDGGRTAPARWGNGTDRRDAVGRRLHGVRREIVGVLVRLVAREAKVLWQCLVQVIIIRLERKRTTTTRIIWNSS